MLAIPGPVRNLKCDYIFMEKQPLRCTWLAPEDNHDILQMYSIIVKYGDQVIHSGSTAGNSYNKLPEFIPSSEIKHEVIIKK